MLIGPIGPISKHGKTIGGGFTIVDIGGGVGITICGMFGIFGMLISKAVVFVLVGGSVAIFRAIGV